MSEGGAYTDPLAMLKQERPRLLATATVVARMKSVLWEDRTAAQWFDELTAQANNIVALPRSLQIGSTTRLRQPQRRWHSRTKLTRLGRPRRSISLGYWSFASKPLGSSGSPPTTRNT